MCAGVYAATVIVRKQRPVIFDKRLTRNDTSIGYVIGDNPKSMGLGIKADGPAS